MEELQQQFDDLTEQKKALWDEIKDNTLYELSDQWKQIAVLDDQLRALRTKIEGGI